jgi:hypothetical protein
MVQLNTLAELPSASQQRTIIPFSVIVAQHSGCCAVRWHNIYI